MCIWKEDLASNVFSHYAQTSALQVTCMVHPSSSESSSFPMWEFVFLTSFQSSFMDCPFSPCALVCSGPSEHGAKSTSLVGNSNQAHLSNLWLVEEAETLQRLVRKWKWGYLVPISGVRSIHLSWTRWSMWVPHNSEYSGKMYLGEVLSGWVCGFCVV